MMGPQVLAHVWPAALAPDKWWMAIPVVLLGRGFLLLIAQNARRDCCRRGGRNCSPSSKEGADRMDAIRIRTW